MREIAQLAYCLQLPKATKEKHFIFLMRMGQYDPTTYSIDDVTRYAFAVTDIINSQPAAQLYWRQLRVVRIPGNVLPVLLVAS